MKTSDSVIAGLAAVSLTDRLHCMSLFFRRRLIISRSELHMTFFITGFRITRFRITGNLFAGSHAVRRLSVKQIYRRGRIRRQSAGIYSFGNGILFVLFVLFILDVFFLFFIITIFRIIRKIIFNIFRCDVIVSRRNISSSDIVSGASL